MYSVLPASPVLWRGMCMTVFSTECCTVGLKKYSDLFHCTITGIGGSAAEQTAGMWWQFSLCHAAGRALCCMSHAPATATHPSHLHHHTHELCGSLPHTNEAWGWFNLLYHSSLAFNSLFSFNKISLLVTWIWELSWIFYIYYIC